MLCGLVFLTTGAGWCGSQLQFAMHMTVQSVMSSAKLHQNDLLLPGQQVVVIPSRVNTWSKAVLSMITVCTAGVLCVQYLPFRIQKRHNTGTDSHTQIHTNAATPTHPLIQIGPTHVDSVIVSEETFVWF